MRKWARKYSFDWMHSHKAGMHGVSDGSVCTIMWHADDVAPFFGAVCAMRNF